MNFILYQTSLLYKALYSSNWFDIFAKIDTYNVCAFHLVFNVDFNHCINYEGCLLKNK